MKHLKLTLLLISVFKMSPVVLAQGCDSCSAKISILNIESYTVSAGQVFCIDTLGEFKGNLVLDGGIICNRGVLRPLTFTFNSGTINNYSRCIINDSLELDSTKAIFCEKKSYLRMPGYLTINGGSFTNKGIVNIKSTVNYISGTFINSGIFNCRTFSGNPLAITNSGIINKD